MRDSVRFLLGDELRELRAVDPTRTVLDYLRLDERRCGTKEGCNEGDCGACTVLLGRLREDGSLRYDAVNACIQFVPTLDGAQLLTVEDLKGADGALHPVQEAMVETHASQCGFCTPGFVMMLTALFENDGAPDHAGTTLDEDWIDEALAGNLCRCTGYAPIVAAAKRMLELGRGRPKPFAQARAETILRLEELQDEATLRVGDGGRRFFAPASADALADLLLEHPEATIVAGATDVGLWVTKELRVLDPVISLGRVRELQRIEATAGELRLGAGVTYTDALPALARLGPAVGALVRRIGAVQVRNMGTLGGNVANGSPIGDSLPLLIALDARIVLRRGTERRTLAVEDFFIDYGRQDRRASEFVETIVIPEPAAGQEIRAYKVSKRLDQDISAVMGAFAVEIAEGTVRAARLAYGGVAGIPKRAPHAERALVGNRWCEATVRSAMAALVQDFAPLTDWRASRDYRARVAANLLHRFYLDVSEPGQACSLAGFAGEPALAS